MSVICCSLCHFVIYTFVICHLAVELSLKAKTKPSALELGVLGLDSLKANTNPSGLELKAEMAPEDDWPVWDDSLKAKTNPSGLELNIEMPALLLTLVMGPDNEEILSSHWSI